MSAYGKSRRGNAQPSVVRFRLGATLELRLLWSQIPLRFVTRPQLPRLSLRVPGYSNSESFRGSLWQLCRAGPVQSTSVQSPSFWVKPPRSKGAELIVLSTADGN